MLSEILSAVIFGVFTLLLVIGTLSTAARWLRYYRLHIKTPVLLKRDAALFGGLAFPFVLIAAVRAFGFTSSVTGDEGPAVWWLLLTGLPPIIALAVYVYYELAVIERERPNRPETVIEREDRQVGDTRRTLQAKNRTGPDAPE